MSSMSFENDYHPVKHLKCVCHSHIHDLRRGKKMQSEDCTIGIRCLSDFGAAGFESSET